MATKKAQKSTKKTQTLPATKDDKALEKIKNTRRTFVEVFGKSGDHPNTILKEAGELLDAHRRARSEKRQDEIHEELKEKSYDLVMALGMDTPHPLSDATPKVFRSFAIEMKEQLCKEYQCTTPSEVMVASGVAHSYASYLFYSRAVYRIAEDGIITHERIGYSNAMRRMAGDAFNRYIKGLEQLQTAKAPRTSLNIKSNTAFVAEQQQVNVGTEPPQNPQ